MEDIEALEFINKFLYHGNLTLSLSAAKRALEKQIPQKPVNPNKDFGTFKCPACGGLIYTEDRLETHRFCLICGQALDWDG